MAYLHYALRHYYYHYDYRHLSSPNPFPTLALLRGAISRKRKSIQRADQGRPVQGQVEHSWLQEKRVWGTRQAARHHTFVWGLMLSERNSKREREHYKHILER